MIHYPSIDLHGEFAITSYTIVHNFISDQIKLKNRIVVIIHGKGTGKLKNAVHDTLKKDKRVIKYNLNPFNLGETIVYLNI